MSDFKIVEITPEEFHEMCKKRMTKDGLYHVVREELDEIVDIAHAYGYSYFSETLERSETILKMIEIFEKEQPQLRGHWLYLQDCANEGVYCSECKTKMFDRYPMKKKLSKFCGHCGAKMDEEIKTM